MDGVNDKDDDDIIKEARKRFEQAQESDVHNREAMLEDLRFAKLSEQWDDNIKRQRQLDGRPCLTINKLNSFVRQVTNDLRQNKPAIRVHPVDSGADVQTAEVINGLMRSIHNNSDAEVAFDSASDDAVTMGRGFIRVDIDYAHDDSFDFDINIKRIADPFSVHYDPTSTASDSSDWAWCFITKYIKKEEFEQKYKQEATGDWFSSYADLGSPWLSDDSVMIAEYWTKTDEDKLILLMSDGSVVDNDRYQENIENFQILGITPKNSKMTKSTKVMQYILTGNEIIDRTEWAGRYIPIIPVYGEDTNEQGKRHFKGIVRDAKDAQRMFNYWRTTTTELVALAPKAPYIAPKNAFNTDAHKWATANTESHAFLEYDGAVMPQRQPFAGIPAGALQEALNASDDMKSIIGIYDAGLGARSNETSGRAILARQKESDTSTFHYADNLNRAIKHTGKIILDLIPHVYNGERVIRVIGNDGRSSQVRLGSGFYAIDAGKYDLTIDAGASFATKREESATQMMELIRAYPQAAPIIGDLLVKNLDWEGAEEISQRLQALLPQQLQGQDQQSQQLQQQNQQLMQQNQQLQQDQQAKLAEVQVKQFDAETKRMQAVNQVTPDQVQQIVVNTLSQIMGAR